MKHDTLRLFLVVTLVTILLTGCSGIVAPPASDKLKVITTLFPQYDFVREIAGDRVDVVLLLPPGMEPHSYEPSPRDIVTLRSADLFVYTTEAMEPWVARIVNTTSSQSLRVVESGEGVHLLTGDDDDDEDHDEDEDDHDHDHGDADPHIWLDPLNAIIMVDNIAKALAEVDPEFAQTYISRARAYSAELQALHETIEAALAPLANRTILYAGHFSFGYFAHRYDLEHISPYSGFAPDAEPTPQRIAELIQRVSESGSNTIFYAELVDPRVARVISEQTGAEMVLLHGVHNVSRDELSSGVTYLELMRTNLARLIEGLKTE
ncbi:MAG TPA: zinc ABC transporter substrate-binding protein [Bacillota bacterium]|nr:zinc ABC transporter substrate-binding protein [Bacillota bacterium]